MGITFQRDHDVMNHRKYSQETERRLRTCHTSSSAMMARENSES